LIGTRLLQAYTQTLFFLLGMHQPPLNEQDLYDPDLSYLAAPEEARQV
jgi:hypothetical protein